MNLIIKAMDWLKNIRSNENKALFIFAAPGNPVKGTGAGLYRAEPAFRESIAQTDQLLQAHGQESILPHFEGAANSGDTPVQAGSPFVGLAIQLALGDLCRSKGLEPAAVLGIGLGEIPALCAAGAISREAAVRILAGSLSAARQPDPAVAPASMRVAMQGIVPGPLGCDYYSCSLGRRLPANSLAPHFLLEDLPFASVHLDKTLQEVMTSPWRTIVHCHVGAPASVIPGDAAFKALRKAGNLYFFEEGQPGGKLPGTAFSRLRLKAGETGRLDSLQQFLAHFDILAPDASCSPQAVNAFLQQYGDVHFLPRSKCWLVLSYELVNQVMQDHQAFSNSHYRDFETFLIGADPPAHTRVRSLVQPHFSPRAITETAVQVERDVKRRMELLSRQPGFEVVGDLSIPIAQAAMGRFLGLSEQAFRELQDSTPHRYHEINSMEAAGRFFHAYMDGEDPAASESGMKHLLLGAAEAGEISRKGAADLMMFFWMAGIMTTTLHLTNIVYELLTRPGVGDELRRDSGLVPAFIGECLRLNPPGVHVMRTSTKDAVLGGKSIPAGSVVVVSVMAANRDPAVFSRADEMLLDRPARRDFAFGGGIHYCLGHHLAKREAQAVVNGILPVLDRLQLDPAAPFRTHFLLDFYGMIHLPVKWR